jgi:hypothetical protein
VPPSQYDAMRAPFQEGDFPAPVKYGYLNVGAVEHGPPELRGRTSRSSQRRMAAGTRRAVDHARPTVVRLQSNLNLRIAAGDLRITTYAR